MQDHLATSALTAIAVIPSDAERDAWARPPYPTPSGLQPFRNAAIAAIQAAWNGTDNPFCPCRWIDHDTHFQTKANGLITGRTGFGVSDTICMLLAIGLLSPQTGRAAAEQHSHPATQRYLLRATLYRLLALGEIKAARDLATHPIFGSESWVAWRAIGEFYARTADANAFFGDWSHYAMQHEKRWAEAMKTSLITAVSQQMGWQAAAALTRHTHLGNGFLLTAVRPLSSSMDADALDALLTTHDDVRGMPEAEKLLLLVEATRCDPTAPVQRDHPKLDALLTRIEALNATSSSEMARQRDALLIECWPLVGEAKSLKRLRASIRAPAYRRQFTGLHPRHAG